MKLVVIGNGMAGVSCIEEILRLAPEKYEITLFGKERHPNYNRVLLSSVLTGEKTLEDITLNDFKWYEEQGITLHMGSPIKRIDRGRRVVVGEDGLEVPYDRLILATGSLPFVPAIPGVDKKGVLSFRNIDDCEALLGAAGRSRRAAVIGGGLLGLEAARGLMSFGIDVTIVHLMDRLMESQLDEKSAALLREDLEEKGLKILLGRKTAEITGNGKVKGLQFDDGGRLETDIVVMSAGIRPNMGLAEEAGIYCERGIVVSDTMQTYDPSVYAVGECVQHRGTCFGLVAPLFEQARVLANHLAGDARLSFVSKPVSTKLKVPGIELYSAGNVSGGAGVETIEFFDRGQRRYKKLFIKENRIEGILLYGDTADGPRLFGLLLEGQDIGEKRQTILFGDGISGGKPTAAVEAMPDETIICGCNGVTKGAIVEAIEKKGLFTREDVERETRAATSCGGCGTLVEQILEATLGSDFQGGSEAQGICGCTKYTREDLIKNIRESRLTSVGAVMDVLGWETVGCEKCRPAINYYVSMVWPRECSDDPTSRVVNERVHANIQKDDTFSVVPRMYGGVTTPEELRRIAEVAIKYSVPLVKVTGGQRLDLLGIAKQDLSAVWKDLEMPSGYAYGKALRTVKTCVGDTFCRYGTQDSMGLGVALEKRFEGLWTPAKVKMGVTGCPRNCAESAIKDVGIIGISGGWEIYVGGCGGTRTRGAELLCTVKREDEVIEISTAFLQYYREEAVYGERTFQFLKRIGLEAAKSDVVENKTLREGLVSRLEEAMGVVSDPWKARPGA
ncbi:MAG: nitrite reductase large subunit NirB [Thermodesulfobacteriota bacterium]